MSSTSGQWKYFIDECLPFGAYISCAIFQRISDTIKFLAEFKIKVPKQITNYLDDFLFMALTLIKCNYMIAKFLEICNQIGIPISAEKTEWGTLQIVFLGILLDGARLILSLPLEKQQKALNLLNDVTN